MARVAFIADVHVGNPTAFGGQIHAGINDRGRHVLDVLERAVNAVAEHDALVVCGDLFDTSNPSPQLIAEVQRILSQGPKTLVLMGNHDMVSDTPGDNALGPLYPIDNVIPVERPDVTVLGDTAILALPFQVGDCREWFDSAVEELAATPVPAGTKKVLAFHLGIIDSDTPAFLAKAHDAINVEVVQAALEKHGIAYAVCGNWHNARKWRTVENQIIQCGALCPTGWDNPGWDYGRVWTIDTTNDVVSSQVFPGPRFMSAHDSVEADATAERAARDGNLLYLTLKGEAGSDPALLEEVRGWGVHARAVADNSAAKAATRAAAQAVKGTSTLDEALAKYISAMPLSEGLVREQVQALAKRYLTAGGAQ
jgi:hypothetical protein